MQRPPGIGNAVSRRLRGLDRRLGIDHSDRSEWIWAIPLLTFVGTLSLFVVVSGPAVSPPLSPRRSDFCARR